MIVSVGLCGNLLLSERLCYHCDFFVNNLFLDICRFPSAKNYCSLCGSLLMIVWTLLVMVWTLLVTVQMFVGDGADVYR